MSSRDMNPHVGASETGFRTADVDLGGEKETASWVFARNSVDDLMASSGASPVVSVCLLSEGLGNWPDYS
jgi:hypothetical protein